MTPNHHNGDESNDFASWISPETPIDNPATQLSPPLQTQQTPPQADICDPENLLPDGAKYLASLENARIFSTALWNLSNLDPEVLKYYVHQLNVHIITNTTFDEIEKRLREKLTPSNPRGSESSMNEEEDSDDEDDIFERARNMFRGTIDEALGFNDKKLITALVKYLEAKYCVTGFI